jgi:hypothetical protein
MAQPTAISIQGVRHEASFNGAGETVVDMVMPRGIGAETATQWSIISDPSPRAKTKLGDEIDLPGIWLHSCSDEMTCRLPARVWRGGSRSAI